MTDTLTQTTCPIATPTLPRLGERAGVGASAAILFAALLSGCGSLSLPGSQSASRPATKPAQKPAPIATRPLNVSSDCSFRDPTGYRGEMKLKVADAAVHAFDARVDVPERGSCRFALSDFRQTETLPNVVLRARGSACTVRMWEQGKRVTVAFNDCADRCSGGAYPYLWPILANRSGGCG